MDWKQIAATAAPVLGTLLGGPAGATVGGLVASALGVENNDAALSAALRDPEQVANLKRWAYEHRERLEQIGLDTLRAELGDKANAREHHKHSPIPAVVTLLLTLLVGGVAFLLFTVEIPAANRDIAYMLSGQVTALWGASVTYWVGTTRSSAEKTRQMVR